MAQEITLAELQTMASHVGLRLAGQELEKLLSGVNRSHKQALELRDLITDSVEPATVFVPVRAKRASSR